MSQMYRVRIKESMTIDVSVTDRAVHEIHLRCILSAEEMLALLERGFVDQGFERQEDGRLHRQLPSGEAQVFDPESCQLSASLQRAHSRQEEVVSEVTRDLDHKNREEIEALARAELPRRQQARQHAAQRQAETEVMQALIQGDAERRETIHRALQGAYAEALKQKARSLGQVVSEQEHRSDSDYELTIRIEL